MGRVDFGPARRFWIEELEDRLTPAAPFIELFDPAPGSNDALADISIVAEFDQAIDPATVTPSTLVVQGMQSGQVVAADVSSLTVSGSTITLDPASGFFAGETIQVTATSGIQNPGGEAAVPYVWQFQIGAQGGTAEFFDSGQSLGTGSSNSIVLGDLNGDGYLDAVGQSKVWFNDGAGNLVDSGLSITTSTQVGLGDIDADGDLDIVGSTVYFNDGSGAFTSGQTNLLNGVTALGDLDADGDLDAVICSAGGVPGKVYFNDGSGTFTDSGQSLGNHFAHAVSLGDVDGDGDLDLLLAGQAGSSARIFRNDGSGTLSDDGYDFYRYGVFDSSSTGGALGDLDGDGDLDVVLASNTDGIGIFLNDGAGSFTQATQTSGDFTLTGVLKVALGDLDADGDLDLVVGNRTSGTSNQVFLNDGSAQFSDSGLALEDNNVQNVAIGDLDNDGDLDILIANANAAAKVYENIDGDLAVTMTQTPTATSVSAGDSITYTITASNQGATGTVADAVVSTDLDGLLTGVTWTAVFGGGASGTVNGTGNLSETVDLPAGATIVYSVTGTVTTSMVEQAAVRTLSSTASVAVPTGGIDPDTTNNSAIRVDLILGATGGTASFSDSGQSLGSGSSNGIVVGDLNGDGYLDAVGQSKVWFNDGAGNLVDSGLSITTSTQVGLGDIDADGDLDIVGSTVYFNDGSGAFTSGQTNLLNGVTALGDLDADGDLDAVICSAGGVPGKVYFNNGSGTFTDSGQSLGNHFAHAVSLGDVDGDGDLDLLLAGQAGSSARIFRNDGSGTLSDDGYDFYRYGVFDSSSSGGALGDLDGDGDLDVVLASNTDGIGIFLNDGAGSFTQATQTSGDFTLTGVLKVALGDLDADGDLDLVVGNRTSGTSNQVFLNDGSAQFSDSGLALGDNNVQKVAIGDLDNDGDLDILIANTNVAAAVYLNADTDLSVTFDASPVGTSVLQGDTIVYTITVTNSASGRAISGAAFTATFADLFSNVTWQAVFQGGASGTSSGSGDISDTVNLAAGATIVYTVTGTLPASMVDQAAVRTLASSATIAAPTNVLDIDSSNDSAISSDVIVLTPSTGTATFADSGQALGSGASNGMALGDIDGDGDLDAVGQGKIWLNDGSGALLDSGASITTSVLVGLGDVDGDGDLDIVGSTVYFNDGSGSFTSGQTSLLSGVTSVGDLDGDGDLDAVIASTGGVPAKVYFNDGSGSFSDSGQSLGNHFAHSVSLGDVDGDGDLDMLLSGLSGSSARTFINDGQGTLSDNGFDFYNFSSFDNASFTAALGDLDGDGDLDAVIGSNDDGIGIFLNNGSGSYTRKTQTAGVFTVTGQLKVALADLDADGDLDLVLGNRTSSVSNQVFLNDGAALFSDSGQALGDSNVQNVAIGDLDNDGDLDVLIANADAPAAVYENQGPTSTTDLQISITDGQSSQAPGASVAYIITATNAGPNDVTGAAVASALSRLLTGVTWTASFSLGASGTSSGAGDIDELVNLQSGATVTYTVFATIPTSATGSLISSATIRTPSGMGDSDFSNNSATDADTLTAVDLAITVDDGQTSAVPGESITYTITVSNTGPFDAVGATVADTFSSMLSNVGWTAVLGSGAAGNTSGLGDINESVNLASGASITYTVTATILSSATGALTNTATITASGGVPETDADDNTATDTDTLTPQVDLQITVDDSQTTAVPGESVTYTIIMTNAGPSDVTGATVEDTFSPMLSNVSWTAVLGIGASGVTSGTGDINESVNLSSGASITYAVTAAILSSATGTLENTATIAAPGSATETSSSDNTATDTDTLTPEVDLQITVDDGQTNATPGESVTYTIIVTNAGPSDVTGATVEDTFSLMLSNVSWTAVLGIGASGVTSGTGDINESVDLESGATITYTVTATILSSATGTLENAAAITAPGSATEADASDNTATDTDTLTTEVDLQITVDDGQITAVPGESVTYTIIVTNAGPSDVTGATVEDTFSDLLTNVEWTAVLGSGASGNTNGTGDFSESVDLASGATITYTVTATILSSATGTLANTATITAPGSATETGASDNTATDSDTLAPEVDLQITVDDGQTSATPGESITYTVTVTNAGPSDVMGATLEDTFSALISNVSWTAVLGIGATGATSGTGDINELVNLASGATITYTVTATILSSATGTLANTATVSAPMGATETNAGDNSSTDSNSLVSNVDLSVLLVHSTIQAGSPATFMITVANAGPSDAVGATVHTELSSAFVGLTWSAVFSAGSSGNTSGADAIDELVNLTSGGSVVYVLTGSVAPNANGLTGIVAAAWAPAGAVEAALEDNQVESMVDLPVIQDRTNAGDTPDQAPSPFLIFYYALLPSSEVVTSTEGTIPVTNEEPYVNTDVNTEFQTDQGAVVVEESEPSRRYMTNSADGPSARAELSGVLFLDMDGDGLFEEGETALQNQSLVLEAKTGSGYSVVGTVQTDRNGAFRFPSLPAGAYRIRGNDADGQGHVIELGPGGNVRRNVGFVPRAGGAQDRRPSSERTIAQEVAQRSHSNHRVVDALLAMFRGKRIPAATSTDVGAPGEVVLELESRDEFFASLAAVAAER